VTVRPMRWWDIESVIAIEHQVFPETAWTAEQFWSELAHVPATRWYVVHEDEQGVDAYVGLFALAPESDVQTIAVAQRSQGRGLGRELMRGLLDEARTRGCSHIFLEVGAQNVAAIALYGSLGFEHQARRSNYYGPGRDALVLRRSLREESVS